MSEVTFTDSNKKRHRKSCGSFQSSVTITRPVNTTAYSANDVIGVADTAVPANAGSAIHALTNCGPAGELMTIRSVQLFHDVTAIPATQTTMRLWLFNASPTAILDNAASTLVPAADATKFLCYVDLATVEDIGGTLLNHAYNVNKEVKLAAGSSTIYAIIQTVGDFTPASGAVFRLQMNLKPAE